MYKLAGQKCTINAHYNVHFCPILKFESFIHYQPINYIKSKDSHFIFYFLYKSLVITFSTTIY